MKDLPLSIRLDVALHLYRDMIVCVPLFNGCEESFLRAVVLLLQPKIYPAQEYIVRKGDIGHEMYFIQRGFCDVIDDLSGETLAKINTGDYFGEVRTCV